MKPGMINETNQSSKRKRSHIMIKKATLIEMLILVIASVILIMTLLSFNVNAQGLSSSVINTRDSQQCHSTIR
jgi:hypothetical protein